MDKWFVILGGNFLLQGVYDKLRSYGYHVLVVDWNSQPGVKGDLHLPLDVKDEKAVMGALESLDYPIDGALTCIDLAVPVVNAINRRYGLAVMPEPFSKEVLTKSHMRECWQRDGLFGRYSETDDKLSESDMIALWRRMSLLVKPNVAASSRGITILPKAEDSQSDSRLAEHLRQALAIAREKSFDGRCLVEEFVEGREFTIDMLGDGQGNLSVYAISTKYHSPFALHNRVATRIHWNSRAYPDEVFARIAEMGKRCYRSLGLSNSFGHLEMLMRPDGRFSPVEIGARSSGFICSHLVSEASGRDYLHDYVRMLHGQTIENADHINGPRSSMWFGYDIPAGTHSVRPSTLRPFLDPRIEVLYSKTDGLKVPGDFGNIIDDNGRDSYGYEMLAGDRDILTIDSVERANREFLGEFLGS